MSQEYSYNELMEMQEQAIRRVKEMQERARFTLENNPLPELEGECEECTSQKGNTCKSADGKDKNCDCRNNENRKKCDTAAYSQNSSETKGHSVHKPDKANSPHAENSSRTGGVLPDFLSLDRDKAVILPILLLLGRDSANNLLLLALMYIMS